MTLYTRKRALQFSSAQLSEIAKGAMVPWTWASQPLSRDHMTKILCGDRTTWTTGLCACSIFLIQRIFGLLVIVVHVEEYDSTSVFEIMSHYQVNQRVKCCHE